VKNALRFCRKSIRAIRKLLAAGLLLHGPKVIERQFLLRRITLISLGCFGILSLLRGLLSHSANGGLSESDKAVLRYALAEAELARKQNGRVLTPPLEKLHEGVMNGLSEGDAA
jgi:hypothetical protein